MSQRKTISPDIRIRVTHWLPEPPHRDLSRLDSVVSVRTARTVARTILFSSMAALPRHPGLLSSRKPLATDTLILSVARPECYLPIHAKLLPTTRRLGLNARSHSRPFFLADFACVTYSRRVFVLSVCKADRDTAPRKDASVLLVRAMIFKML